TALGGYYDDCVVAVAARSAGAARPTDDGTRPTAEAVERQIREWFSYRLISEKNTRLPVMLVEDQAGGLPPGVLPELGKDYLIRKEVRPNFSWVELAHDRLIGPIRQINNAWFRSKLSPL